MPTMIAVRRDSRGLGLRRVAELLTALLILAVGSVANAATLQAPAGGAPIPLPAGRVACSDAKDGWTLDAVANTVTPPANAEAGAQSSLPLATSSAECASSKETLRLIATAPLPTIDPSSVVLALNAGRLEIAGTGLAGLRVSWKTQSRLESNTCVDVSGEGPKQRCTIPLTREQPSEVTSVRFSWVPAGGRFGKDVRTYDSQGSLLGPGELELTPGRIVLGRVMQRERSVDVSSGVGQIPLAYPDVVASVECDGAQCELTGRYISVRAVPLSTSKITVRAKLLPRVFLARANAQDDSAVREFEVVRCDLNITSGPPLRDVSDVRLLARLPVTCGLDADRLNWTINGQDALVERTEAIDGYIYVLLRHGRILDDEAVVVATRPQDQSVLALSSIPTSPLLALHTSLVLPGFGEIDFIPKNQDVQVATSTVGGGRFVPIEVPGAYRVTHDDDGISRIRGVYASSGFTSLKLGYRVAGVPAAFADVDFATLTDPIQRPIREANLPIPLGASSNSGKPVVELRCATDEGKVERIAPGQTRHIPFAERDSCRLEIHRARIPAESGEQLIEIDVSVSTSGDVERSDARMSERLLLRHGPHKEVIWIRGARQQFDRIRVRVHHIVEEASYLLGHGSRYRLPTGQWTVVTEDATLKFYATASIPSGLFRFSDDPQDLGTGALSLNFGVLSRLTLLNDEGKESLIGLESGVMTMGLATEKDRQLAIVAGLGVGVPLGNANQPTQASLNIHAWVAYTLGKREGQLTDDAGSPAGRVDLNPWAIVFGPSITIGSLAAYL